MKSIKQSGWLFVVIVVIWIDYPFALGRFLGPTFTLEDKAQFGDSFGALNTLFAGLALVGLAINIYMQNEQIRKLEKKEDETEGLLKKQVDVMKQTALLQYYNETISRVEQQVFELRSELSELCQKITLDPFGQSAMTDEEMITKTLALGDLNLTSDAWKIKARLTTRKSELEDLKRQRREILKALKVED